MSDLISRTDAIEWLTNEKWTNANNKYKREWNEVFDMAIEALQDRPNGEWENVYSGLTDDTLRFRCNHCGAVSDGRHNYCPNCGARMKGGEDE